MSAPLEKTSVPKTLTAKTAQDPTPVNVETVTTATASHVKVIHLHLHIPVVSSSIDAQTL